MIKKVAIILEMIKFQHTVFALPFAILSACYAADGVPTMRQILWLLVAMVSARSAALAFNRMADATFDAKNPRTQERAIPKSIISIKATAIFTLTMAGLFIFSSAMLNETCLILSPIALIIVLGYSYTKRFTVISHFILGLGLALAPIGSWLAIRETLDAFPILLGTAVMLWTAGFDVIYSCLDVNFDRSVGLYSIPAKFGIRAGLIISALLHATTVVCLFAIILFGKMIVIGIFYKITLLLITALLIYEHIIAKPDEPQKINTAFFIVNAIVSITIMVGGLIDLFIGS